MSSTQAAALALLGQLTGSSSPVASPKRRFTAEHLVHVHSSLLRNRAPNPRTQNIIIENLRTMAEVVVYGDMHDPRIFEAFLEHGMMDTIMSYAEPPRSPAARAVLAQLLQTLSIVTQNVRTQPSLFFLLSNKHMDGLCRMATSFTDDELVCNVITFMKAIALSLTDTTVQFFAGSGSFPLYESAVAFASHHDQMVVSAVRTIALSIYRLRDAEIRGIVLSLSPSGFWRHLSDELQRLTTVLGTRIIASARPGHSKTLHQALIFAGESHADLLDLLYYVQDVMLCEEDPPTASGGYAAGLSRVLLAHWVQGHLVHLICAASILQHGTGLAGAVLPRDRVAIEAAVALHLVAQSLLVVDASIFSPAVAACVLAPSAESMAHIAPSLDAPGVHLGPGMAAARGSVSTGATGAGRSGPRARSALLSSIQAARDPVSFHALSVLAAATVATHSTSDTGADESGHEGHGFKVGGTLGPLGLMPRGAHVSEDARRAVPARSVHVCMRVAGPALVRVEVRAARVRRAEGEDDSARSEEVVQLLLAMLHAAFSPGGDAEQPGTGADADGDESRPAVMLHASSLVLAAELLDWLTLAPYGEAKMVPHAGGSDRILSKAERETLQQVLIAAKAHGRSAYDSLAASNGASDEHAFDAEVVSALAEVQPLMFVSRPESTNPGGGAPTLCTPATFSRTLADLSLLLPTSATAAPPPPPRSTRAMDKGLRAFPLRWRVQCAILGARLSMARAPPPPPPPPAQVGKDEEQSSGQKGPESLQLALVRHFLDLPPPSSALPSALRARALANSSQRAVTKSTEKPASVATAARPQVAGNLRKRDSLSAN